MKRKKIKLLDLCCKAGGCSVGAYAMGIDWYMTDIELSSAIPPAYTHYIGLQFFQQ